MKIRNATLKDIPTCYELAKMPELLTAEKKPVPTWWLEAIVKESQIFLIAEEKNKIIGFIIGEILAGNISLLWIMGVQKNHRKKGIGKKLLQSYEKEARKKGTKAILLYGFKKNPETIKFWENNGYIRGEETIEFLKYWED